MEKKPKMTVVDGRGFDEITDDLTTHIAQIVNNYGLSQKMATRLVRDAWGHVEMGKMFRGDPVSYVREHLDEQIKGYIRLGVHALTGLTEAEFTSSLGPLVEKTVNFFRPPAGHPIVDGEFTCFLVIPEEWGCSLRTLLGRLRPNSSTNFREMFDRLHDGRTVEDGEKAPATPYVLVGIKGGRGFRDLSLAAANKEREKFGLTYFSAHQLALLFYLCPKFLTHGERAIALGEEFSEQRYLQFDAFPDGLMASLVHNLSPSGLQGTGKPYYTRLIKV